MRRESLLGRTAWPVLLVLLLGYVVADFAHYPFIAPAGSAAVPPPALTLWVVGTDEGAAELARRTAASFDLQGRPTAVKTLDGGSAAAVSGFLGGTRRPALGAQLLVVTSTTLADLARDRRDRLVPGAALQSARAQLLLSQSAPVGVLAGDPLALAVPRDSSIRRIADLMAQMRTAPEARLFAIGDDTWSRAQLAALVDGAGVSGHARFSAYPSGSQAALAAELGDADTVLATRSSLREDVREGRLRQLAWPLNGGRAPRAWSALVAPPQLPLKRVAELRRALRALTRAPRWRQLLHEEGRTVADVTAGPRLDELLGEQAREADALQQLSERVERR